MRAARLYGPRDVRIEEVDTPTPGPGEVLVRVAVVAICASDWRLYSDGHAGGVVPEHPIIQGHEFSGDIIALGEGVDAPPIGTRVAVEPSWHCGRCDLCRQGLTNICRNVVFPSFPPRDGALAEAISCPAFAVHPLPDHVGYTEGALVEPLGVGMHAVRLAAIRPSDQIVILGAGAIGMCSLLMAQAHGARRVAVTEPVAGRREWPQRVGAGPVVRSCEELQHLGVEGDVVFECSGSNAAPEQAMRVARPGGKVVIVGIPQPEHVVLDASIPRRKELTVIFSRRSRNTLAEAVDLVASRRVDLSALPTRRFSLEQSAEALEATGSQPRDMLRAVVLPTLSSA